MTRIFRFLFLYCFIFICFLLAGCSKEEDEPVESRTVLVYLAADNNLNQDGYDNIELMLKGWRDYNGHLVIYFDSSDRVPELLTLEKGEDGKVHKRVLETYPEENSASGKTLARVISDTKRLFPAESYGLILWSHGMAWLPESFYFPEFFGRMGVREYPRTKYFGQDYHRGDSDESSYLDIHVLAEVLPDSGFHFILFDACFMASVEVLYELRNKSDYIIASPAEVLAAGFPYDKILPYLWGGEEDLKQICREFYDLYHAQSGDYQSATVSLTRTAELESLADITREILRGKTTNGIVPEVSVAGVRRYEISSNLPRVFYDFGEFVCSQATAGQLSAFDAQVAKTVIFKKATEQFFGEPIPAGEYSGLSSYIPLQRWASMNPYYATYSWYRSVY